MAEPRACLEGYRRPDKKFAGAISGEYGGYGKTATFSDIRNCFTISDVFAGALLCKTLNQSCKWPPYTFDVSSEKENCSYKIFSL